MAIITGGPIGGSNDYWDSDLIKISMGSATVATSTELKVGGFSQLGNSQQNGELSKVTFVDIKGTNFTYDMLNGLATGGTITSITDSIGTSVTGLNVSLVSFWNAVATGDPTTLNSLLFGGNDTITATGNGTAAGGGNHFIGGAGNDVFNMQALDGRGDFQLRGGAGDDTFNFGSGYGNSSVDILYGDAGNDTLTLNGDYSSTINRGAGAVVETSGVEKVQVAAGHNYNLYLEFLDDPLFGSSSATAVTVDASALGASDSLGILFDSFDKVPVTILGGAGVDSVKRNLGMQGYPTENVTYNGGGNVDTVIYGGNRSAYTITQTATGTFTVAGSMGNDTLTNVEYAKFDDQTMRLLPGTGTAVTWSDPSTYMSAIRDFDGNDLGGAASWKLIGTADVNGDGSAEHILFNKQIGRWAEVGTEADGKTYFSNNGWAGDTRVVGIYIDPLVANGTVVKGSDTDSQRRFQNDLQIDNINKVLGFGDYNHDGLQEIYFSLTDGTAYLHAYMHADGNIQYANYQNKQQVIDYLTTNGVASSTWSTWFPASQTAMPTFAAIAG